MIPFWRRVALAAAGCLVACPGFFALGAAPASGAGRAGVPLPSAVETSNGSWAVLPMGELSNTSNTFWQVLHGAPGSSHWSVVTPEGVANNGGVVAGASAASTLIGTLPSGLLRFSPLSLSVNGGANWSPVFLPGALAARPDALADGGDRAAASLAIVGTTVLRARSGLTSWSSLVSLHRLNRAAPRCDASALDAVAVGPTGNPLVAAACRRGGTVAVFSRPGGSWMDIGPTPPRALAGWSTNVLRLESGGPVTTALVAASRDNHTMLVAYWQRDGGWSASAPLALPGDGAVLASSLGAAGSVAVTTGPKGAPLGYDLVPGGAWTRLPALPPDTSALGPLETGIGLGGPSLDAFTVAGTALGVYALTPAGTGWAKVQSTQVPLAYGSSS